MKRVITLIVILITSLIVFFNHYINLRTENYDNLLKTGEGMYTKKVYFTVKDYDNDKMYYKLSNCLRSLDGNLFCDDYDNTGRIKYVLATDLSLFSSLPLDDGRFFTSNELESDVYLSTTKQDNDPKCIGVISSFGKNYSFQIRTLKSFFDNNADPINKRYTIVLKDPRNFELLKSELEKEGVNITEETAAEDTAYTGSQNKSAYIGGIVLAHIAVFVLCILFFYSIVLSGKKIAVKKLMGYSLKTIWLQNVMAVMALQVATFVSSLVALSFVLFDRFNSLYFIFINTVVKSYFYILVLTIVLMSLPLFYIKRIPLSDAIKYRRPIKTILRFNLSAKLVFGIVFVIVCSTMITDIKLMLVYNNDKFGNWDKVKSFAYVKSMRSDLNSSFDCESKDTYQKLAKMYPELNKKGAILADFEVYSPLYENDLDKMEFVPRTSVTINPNYLELFPIKDTNGIEISVSENEKENVLLVPIKYKDKEEEILEYYNDKTCFSSLEKSKIIWLPNNKKYFSVSLNTEVNNYNMIEDPIFYVMTENNCPPIAYTIADQSFFKIPITDVENYQNEINEMFGKYFNTKDVIFVANGIHSSIRDQISETSRKIRIELVLLVIALIAEIIVIFQGVFVYTEHYRYNIAVKKLMGYGFVDRYCDLFIDTALLMVVLTIIEMIIIRKPSIIMINILLLIADFVLSYIIIKLKDTQNIIKITKKG